MTISRYLKVTLFASIGIVFVVGLVGIWVRDKIHQTAYESLERRSTVLLLLDEVERGTLSAQNSEKSFLLRYPIDGLQVSETHAAKALSSLENTRAAMQSISELNREMEPDAEREALQARIDTLLSLFELRIDRVVKLAERKGDASSGLVWEMRRMVEGLERYLDQLEEESTSAAKRAAVSELKHHLLFIRRWEKDYFLRDDLIFISSVRGRVSQIESSFAGNLFLPRERDRILTYLNTYLIYFERIAMGDVQVLDERNQLNTIAIELHEVVTKYVAHEYDAFNRDEALMRQRERTTTIGLILLFMVILGVAGLMAYSLTRRITGRLDTLVDAAEELGERGECPTIQMDTDDEFARLADSFNGMVENLRNTQLQLVQSEKLTATGKLSASIAHEINNPLFGIQGCLERIAKRLPGEDKDSHLVQLAIRESQRIARLVQGMRDYHSPSDQTMADVDLLDLLDDVFLINAKYLEQAKVELVRDLPRKLPRVSGTRDQLQMVFVNLMTNAVEAMPEGGKITVSANTGKGRVRIIVTDTGKGIDEEAMGRIFEPFFSTKSEVKGVGLGLSISHGIVKRHGGTIRVKSEPEKTVFTVSLPTLSSKQKEA